MARRFLDNIKADVDTLLADNTTGDISAADVRLIFTDCIDSLKQDECVLQVDTPKQFTATGTYQILTVYDSEAGGDGVFLKPNIAGGFITTATQAGWTYSGLAIISFTASNNEEVEFSFSIDGVATSLVVSVTGRGAGRPVTAVLVHEIRSSLSNSNIAVSVRVPAGGSQTLEIEDGELQLTIQPTNNP